MMSLIERIRIYHAALAVLALLSYLSGEWGLVHSWLGYGVAAVIVVRLGWALTGVSQLGLSRFYPSFAGIGKSNFLHHPAVSKVLILGVAISLIGATLTGIMMDRGRALRLHQSVALVSTAYADEDEHDDEGEHRQQRRRGEHERNEAWEELHEGFSNLMLLFVAMHASYLLLFRLPMARYMLFLPPRKKTED